MHPTLPGLTLLAALVAGCSTTIEPRTGQQATEAPGVGAPAGPSAPGVQQNDCPEHVFCHPQWIACHCTRTERGELAMMEADFDGDGRPDLRTSYFYDDAGNLLRWENDRGADGSIDLPCAFEPPCPPPHPNDACSCYGPPREVSEEYVKETLRQAGQ